MKGSISQIGPYRIGDKIGSGGMATVYRAVRSGVEGFERAVAVKVLHPHLASDSEYVEMFRAEARLAARLAHPVLVPVTDLGVADGTHYMAMDVLEGQTLADVYQHFHKKKKAFPRGHALWIIARVLDGLHYAHELCTEEGAAMGVVHRDVSPRNIFVSRSGAVRLVDFGIARHTSRKGQTQIGVVKGTVPYMAPEQARGEPLDRRADLFAVGVLLHQLLTDEVPLAPRSTDEQRRALAAMELEPELKRIHLTMRPMVARALQVRPEDRYQTAAEMADDLRTALAALEAEHQPGMLAAMVSQTLHRKAARKVARAARRAKRAAGAEAAEPRPSTAVRKARDEGAMRQPRAGETGAVPLQDRPLPEVPPWDGPRTLALAAVLILLIGLLDTFLSVPF